MKKIISSAIAIAMLSSTVAMAATVIAPTPQYETTVATAVQNFDSQETKDSLYADYGSGAEKVSQEGYNTTVAVEGNPFDADPSTTTDKVVSVTRTTGGDFEKFIMYPNKTLNPGDAFKISFDVALKNGVYPDNIMQLHIRLNGESSSRSVFKLFTGGWLDSNNTTATQPKISEPTDATFTHYEITFNPNNRTVQFISGNKISTAVMSSGMPNDITSFDSFTLSFSHAGASGIYYIDNLSYSIVNISDEILENFDTLSSNVGGAWNKNGALTNALYRFNGENVENTQTIDLESNRGNVLKLSGGASNGNYVAMPLDYTMDDDDVFTFQFDYAEESSSQGSRPMNGDECTVFRLEDYSLPNKRDMGFTFTKADDPSKTYTTNTSRVFTINGGYVMIADSRWDIYDTYMSEGKFYTITVVIDNSDDEIMVDGKPQRTLAVYVDDNLQNNTKWIMTDKADKESSKTINGVSLTFGGTYAPKYFDNLWASLADNDIKVDGDNVSYTYPVVYDDATPAIFVKAYYDGNNRLISADTASATPSTERTVKTTLSAPANTAKTKVFRWNSLDAIQNLSPAYDSSKVN